MKTLIKKLINHPLFFIFISLVLVGTNKSVVQGQIVPDNSLGKERSLTTNKNKITEITGGAVRGNNLFHSFKEFSVPSGKAFYFIPQGNVVNIFTRVTGGNISQINGILGIRGQANLFFLNPKGIIFGKNAKLDLKGSFVASTGESFIFPDGSLFSAAVPQGAPLLTVNAIAPIGIKLGNQPAKIINQGTLTIEPFKNIALIGAGIDITQGKVIAPKGYIEIGSVAANNTININISSSTNYLISYRGVGSFENINLTKAANLYTSGAGKINLHGKSLTVAEGSRIDANNSGTQPGADIKINATEGVEITGQESRIFTQTVGSGKGGDLTIESKNLTLSLGGQIYTLTKGSGKGGNLVINAQDSVKVNGLTFDAFGNTLFTQLGAAVFLGAPGTGGDVIINTGKLSVLDGGIIATGTTTFGNSGNLQINARESVEVRGFQFDLLGGINPSILVSGVLSSTALGNGGNVTIQTPKMIISDRGIISGATFGFGNGGNVKVSAKNFLLSNGGIISAATSSFGNGGNVEIMAEDSVEVRGIISDSFGNGNSSAILTGVIEPSAIGKGGNVSIQADKIKVKNGGLITSATAGLGDAGNVNIKSDYVEVNSRPFDSSNGGIVAEISAGVRQGAQGNGGNVTVDTGKLVILNGAIVTTATLGSGNGGNIEVKARDLVRVEGVLQDLQGNTSSSRLVAGVVAATGNAGNVTVDTGKLIISNGGDVSSSSTIFATGNAGDVFVNANNYVAIQGVFISNKAKKIPSDLSAAVIAATGNAGNVTIFTPSLSVNNGSVVTVLNTGIGVNLGTAKAGNVKVVADSVSLDNRSGILATNISGNGGNISLTLQNLLLLRRQSLISTAVGAPNSGGVGGNINIDTQFIVAFPSENSNIIGNAFAGPGGAVTISSQNIFGIFPKSNFVETSLSEILSSSRVVINNLNINPNVSPVLATPSLVNIQPIPLCEFRQKSPTLVFYNFGHGGTLPAPEEYLVPQTGLFPWVDLDSRSASLEQNKLMFSHTALFLPCESF